MTTTTGRPATDTFPSLDPATGEVLATYPVASADDVGAAVDRARITARWWGDLTFTQRKARLGAWKSLMANRLPELADLVSAETGKPFGDAVLECVLAIEHLAWAAGHAERVLGRRRVSPGLLMANQKATVAYRPYGVVGVIGPWNYPLHTPMGSISYALAAGNAVVFKPSEHTPGVGVWLARTLEEVVPEQPLLQTVTGLGATGAALCTAGVDKVAFTGSTATAKKIMAACAETLTPVLLECGGKDPMIVDADADLAKAADAAVWGAMSNAGQTCVGIERVYVHERVYEQFLERVAGLASTLAPGTGPGASYGPATMPAQLEVIRGHVRDALDRGGRAVVGGAASIGDRYVSPVVLTDVPEESSAVQEETFGPTVVVNRVRDMDEAVDLANASRYGLGASVFSRRGGEELARRLRCGMASVNSVISFAGIPSLPFGGVGDSGFGRIHGADGLREFATPQGVAVQRFPSPLAFTTFARSPRTERVTIALVRLVHGRS